MTKIYMISAIMAVSIMTLGQTAFAADIGIMGGNNNNFVLVDTAGNKTKYLNVLDPDNRTLLLANRGYIGNSVLTTQSDEMTWSGDFLSSHDGLEYLTTDNRQVRIYDAAGNQLDHFKTTGNAGKRALGIGDIFSDITGQEILVCRQESKHAKINVYSYDESTGEGAEELSFTPFQDLVDQDIEHGCGGLNVAVVDGAVKILATQHSAYSPKPLIYVFNSSGELEGQIAYNDYGSNYAHFDVLDFSGDGVADDVAMLDDLSIKIFNLSSGAELDSLNLSDRSYVNYAIGEINGRVGDEIVVMYGKKSNTLIWNSDGTTDLGQLYPDANKNRDRKLVVGDFSSIIE